MGQLPPKKTDLVIQHMKDGDWRSALRIAKTFKLGLTKDQVRILGRAHEAYHYGATMAQMKLDPEACIQRGIALLTELYGARIA